MLDKINYKNFLINSYFIFKNNLNTNKINSHIFIIFLEFIYFIIKFKIIQKLFMIINILVKFILKLKKKNVLMKYLDIIKLILIKLL